MTLGDPYMEKLGDAKEPGQVKQVASQTARKTRQAWCSRSQEDRVSPER